jgi:hypothetical protein
MKIKIIKQYELREGRHWLPEQIADVTNDSGKQLIKDGYAHEIRIEKRKDSKGHEFEVQVEVLDNKGTTISKKIKDKD